MAKVSPKGLFLHAAGLLVRAVYHITTTGKENLPAGGALLLPNHITWVDALVLQAACPRPIRFVLLEEIYRNRWLNPLFRFLRVIPISSRKARDAIRHATDAIRAGELVCVFPEGELTRTGTLLRLKPGYQLIAREAESLVVPVWLDQLWGSIFSFHGGRYFKKLPQKVPYPVAVAFGRPIPAAQAGIDTVRRALLDLGERCYQQRPILRGNLAEAALRGLKRRAREVAIIDGLDDTRLTRGDLLAVSLALARFLRRHCPKRRIGAVLPTGRGAVIANLAILLAGKVPVNLNFTAGRAALEAAQRIAELDDAISARAFAQKQPTFPFPPNVLYLEDLVPQLRPWILFWRIVAAVLPWWLLAPLLGIPRRGGHQEATVLFTSGSSGEPKGVVLSHRNILANVSQFSIMLNLSRHDTLLACLPFFHSFGCTVTLWYPLIEGIRMVTFPNPLDPVANAALIERHHITMLLSTPTFLRGYLRRATRGQLASLRLVITGAEKLPRELANAFEEKFGIEVLQGYGLTETSPVVSVNLPPPVAADPATGSTLSIQPSNRPGSVGKLAPGITAAIRDPDTGAERSLHDTGMLWLRGPNIFEGYLADPARTAEVLVDGWFKTGDLARFDEDGFLYIEGRLSRFSKIGGEMIPHETVESAIIKALGLPADERLIALTGIPDESKGEQLVLLAACDLDPDTLRDRLRQAGLANLWIPRRILRVEAIPVLASGKLDLAKCRALALAGSPPR